MAMMSLQAAYDQARSYLEANKVEQAIGVAQHILEYFPESLEAHRILGEAYLAGRQFEQAEMAFARVLRADPEDIPAHVGLGITYERQGKLDQAVTEFEQALEVRPDMPELRSQLLRLYTDIWGSESATLRLSRPGLARLYAKGHMLPQAIQEFRGVVEEQPERFDARVGLAEALWRNGQEQQAAEVCTEILNLRPEVLKANLLLGYIKLAAGDPSGEIYWRRAQQLDPYQVVARNLFEVLPDIPPPDLQIPAWDEAAWAERRAREEAERRAAATPAPAVAVVEEQDRLEPALLAAETTGRGGGFDADDFLASLLAIAPPLPSEVGGDLDSSSGVVPFEEEEQPTPSGGIAPESDLEPFSLKDLDLSEAEIAQLQAEPESLPADSETAPPAAEARDQIPTSPGAEGGGEPELTPFSLEDLGLSPEEIASLNAISSEVDTTSPAPAAEEPELKPFSLEELGLSPEEIASLNAISSEVDTAPPAPGAEGGGEPELTPFSLEDLGLSSEEIASLNAISSEVDTAPPASVAEAPSPTPEIDTDIDLGELTPFSLDELDLNATGYETSSDTLPPSLRPFSIDHTPEAGIPPIEEEAEPGGAYSWQQPSAKPQPGFARRRDEEPSEGRRGSIFERLKAQAAARPPQEPEPLRPVSDEELKQSDYFSSDDVSLRDDDTTAANHFTGAFRLPKEEPTEPAPVAKKADQPAPEEPELKPFSLEELGLSPEEIAQLEAAQAAQAAPPPAPSPAPEEPELKPFSLEELGLSPEEIAQLEAAQAAQAAPPPAQPSAPEEPELKPFSLEELGLSPEEIAQLEAAARGDLPIPATGETIVPGWSRGEEPELTPFTPDEQGAETGSGADLDMAGIEPFTLDEFTGGDQAAPSEDILPGDIQPFSFDDLDLGQPDSFGAQQADQGLGLSPEELEGLDFGEFESILERRDIAPGKPEDPDAAFERLMQLGQRQGYVDLTDIIAIVSDPEAEADRIEEIGWALHRAGIQIRDGDEIIDMEEGEEEELYGEEPAAVATEPAKAPADVEPDLTPFSLEELGLSPEEIAALGLNEVASAGTAAAPAPPPAAEEPELRPFSLEELGLSPEEIAQLEAAQAAQAAPAQPPAAEEPELKPFSLEELGLSPEEIAQLEAAQAAQAAPAPPPAAEEPELKPFSLEELGLSPEEIAQLEAAQAAQAAPAPSQPPAAEEPELKPFSLEELGLSPEEIAQLEAAQAAQAAQAAPAPSQPPAAEEPELKPFSLEELGLSPEEIAQLEAAQAAQAAPAPSQPPAAEEPELKPFSLEELGLSPEEIAALELAGVEEAPPVSSQASVESEEDLFNFDLGGAAPVERATKRTAPREAPPPPPVDPEDAAFQPEPLDSLDDIWQTPFVEPPAPAAAKAETPRTEVRADVEPAGRRMSITPPPRQIKPAPLPRREGERLISRGRDEERYARREAAKVREPSVARSLSLTTRLSDLIPTGDPILDEYLRQLEEEPENAALALAIGRLCAQTGRADVMVMAYKGLVRTGQELDLVVEELESLTDAVSEASVQRQLFRLLGDAYAKQGRSREAIAAYGRVFAR